MTRSLIIGATGGIGRAVCATLAARGDIIAPYGRERTGQVYQQDVDYLIFLQRSREDEDKWQHEFNISLSLTKDIVESTSWSSGADKAIVIVSSVNAHLVHPGLPIGYHMAKAALESMARYWAVTLGSKGIRVNCVAPGTVYKGGEPWGNVSFHNKITPLGFMGTAGNVASVIAFLASPAASFVTGQVITVDGGVSLQWQESLANELSQTNDLPPVRVDQS